MKRTQVDWDRVEYILHLDRLIPVTTSTGIPNFSTTDASAANASALMAVPERDVCICLVVHRRRHLEKPQKQFQMGQPIGRTGRKDVTSICNLTWKTDCHTAIGLTGATAVLSQSELIFN
jgi:hypothetical protein